MSLAPLPSPRRPERMLAGPGMLARRLPSARVLARRRLMIQATKFALPAVALALLASLAVWPEMQSQMGQAEAASLPVSSHLFVEASAHVLPVTPTAHWLEYLDIAGSILAEKPRVPDGFLTAVGPGLGIRWDEDAIKRYLV